MKYGFCRRVCINLDLIGRRFAKQIHRDEAKRNRDEFFGVDWKKSNLYEVLKVQTLIILDSSMVEHSAVNRVVVGSNPTRGVFFFLGSMVKRLRHRPFTAVTRVQIPLESFLAQQCAELKVISRMPMWLNWQSSWFVISRLSVRVRSSAYIFGPLAQLVRATGS